MIGAGDKVVCVADEFSTCNIHNSRVCGPDPHPEMVGKIFTVRDAKRASFPDCIGIIILVGNPYEWCVGCFRKIDKADDEFINSLKVKEPA